MKRVSASERVRQYAESRGWERIGEQEAAELKAQVPGCTAESLAACGIAVEAPWFAVRQHTLEDLRESLEAFTSAYELCPHLRTVCREEVIRAKDRAKWASRSERVAAEKRALKTEMVEWMMIWLSDPTMFPTWVRLREARREAEQLTAGNPLN